MSDSFQSKFEGHDYVNLGTSNVAKARFSISVAHFDYLRIWQRSRSTWQTGREYVYVNGMQVALVDDTGTAEEETYFVHNDHLGTPQKITDEAQAVVWDGSYEPFGEVTELVAEIDYNIRFPGQYEDGESGLNYNYYRDYSADLGRYIASDPVGLTGGMNSYAYALSDPVYNTDPFGLFSIGSWGIGLNIPWGPNPFGPGIGGDISVMIQECCNANEIEQRIYVAWEFGVSVGTSVKFGGGRGSLASRDLMNCSDVDKPMPPRSRADAPGMSVSGDGFEFASQWGWGGRFNFFRDSMHVGSVHTGQCC